MTVPGLPDITAAWHALPVETRDRIGIIAVDMVFQAFVHGDAYPPEDRAVLDEAAREGAATATDARLNEIYRVVEGALPDLFGADGCNPAWSENAGPDPSPAALEAAAVERADDEARKRERDLLDALYPERSADDAMAIAMWRSRAREVERAVARLRPFAGHYRRMMADLCGTVSRLTETTRAETGRAGRRGRP